MPTRRAKIVCTIGPASQAPERLRELIEAGMNVARLNFSHGTHAEHRRIIQDIRRLSRDLARPVAILQDLQGPKIRTGRLKEDAVQLQAGARFILTTREVEGDHTRVSTSYADLPSSVEPGDEILLSDGLLRLEVCQVRQDQVECVVVDGGAWWCVVVRGGACWLAWHSGAFDPW